MKKQLLFLSLIIGLLSFKAEKEAAFSVTGLRCELLVDPRGIDASNPRLSWELDANERALEQSSFQILVASSPSRLNVKDVDLWNSGIVKSSQSNLVTYRGKPLSSRANCYWKVIVKTRNGQTETSKAASWSMGLLNKADWKARWIGLDRAFPWDSVTKMARLSARYFRKEFTVPKKIQKATAYISGLGLYELYINGQKIGDQVLAPSPTDYSKSVKYNTFDVTANVSIGKNAIATVLGNGRFFTMRQNYKPQKWHTFGFPKMLCQLEITYTDGTRQLVNSDQTWKATADGPIRSNNEYDGEDYDATKELTGWNKVVYRASRWLAAELVKAPGGAIVSQMNDNMRVMEQLSPLSIKAQGDGKYILDMGQNMAGWIKMNVKGKAGDKVMLRFAESLQPDGELYVANLRDALSRDNYTLKGGATETWNPTFVYHGFRYIEITGYPGKPQIGDFTGEVVYDDIATTGSFETSSTMINQIYKNAYWGIRSNYKGMPVDCPQRNERQPWLGDRSTGAYGESFIFDNSRLYAKWLDDIEQAQTPEGSIPDVAPSFWYYYKDDVTWPATYLMIAEMLYNQYGDLRSIDRHYPSMKKWMTYMREKYMKGYLFSKDSYGDWCVPPESPELIHSKDPARVTDPQLIASATYFHMLQLMERFANLTGRETEASGYGVLAAKIKAAFNDKFYDQSRFIYSNNTVTANILPLAFNMVPADAEQRVFGNIADKTMIENKGHISTGVIGTQWLMRWLTRYGRADIAYRLASVDDYPGWGYMVKNGATTIWELWNGNTANPQMNSQNHVMLLGDLIVWMYEDVAGIKASAPGFKRIEMKPALPLGLDFVNASYRSVHGEIKSSWKRQAEQFTWNISVPANTKAVIYIPAASAESVLESGNKVSQIKEIKFLKMEKDRAVFEIGSGTYSFVTSLTAK